MLFGQDSRIIKSMFPQYFEKEVLLTKDKEFFNYAIFWYDSYGTGIFLQWPCKINKWGRMSVIKVGL